MKAFKKAYFIAKKDMGAYYPKPPLISLGLMFPVVFVLAFYFRNPTGIKEVVPGLTGLTLLFSCTSMAAIRKEFGKNFNLHLNPLLSGERARVRGRKEVKEEELNVVW